MRVQPYTFSEPLPPPALPEPMAKIERGLRALPGVAEALFVRYQKPFPHWGLQVGIAKGAGEEVKQAVEAYLFKTGTTWRPYFYTV